MDSPLKPPVVDEDPPENVEVVQMNLDDSVSAVRSAAFWFFLIAVLSFINTFMMVRGSFFILGLALSQIVDGMVLEATGEINYYFSLIVPLIFIGIGVLAVSLRRWAFLLGGILYLLDGVIYIFYQEWMAVGIHAYILYRLYGGYRTISEYEALKEKLSQ